MGGVVFLPVLCLTQSRIAQKLDPLAYLWRTILPMEYVQEDSSFWVGDPGPQWEILGSTVGCICSLLSSDYGHHMARCSRVLLPWLQITWQDAHTVYPPDHVTICSRILLPWLPTMNCELKQTLSISSCFCQEYFTRATSKETKTRSRYTGTGNWVTSYWDGEVPCSASGKLEVIEDGGDVV